VVVVVIVVVIVVVVVVGVTYRMGGCTWAVHDATGDLISMAVPITAFLLREEEE